MHGHNPLTSTARPTRFRSLISAPDLRSALKRLSTLAARREAALLALLLALTLVRGIVYMSIVPPWQVPDEPYHFYSAWLPLLPPAPHTDAAWRNLQTEIAATMLQFHHWDYMVFEQSPQDTEDKRARLEAAAATRRPATPRTFSYYLLAMALRIVQGQDILLQLYWARLWSVLTNLGIILLAVIAGRLLFRGDPFGSWLLPLLIVLHPKHTFILAGVNDGNIAELFASAAIVTLIALICSRLRWRWLPIAVVFASLAVAAKPTAAFLTPIFLVVIASVAWQQLPTPWRWGVIIVGLLCFAGLFVAIPRLSNEMRALESYVNREGWPAFLSALATYPLRRGALWAFHSFWAHLGWESLPLRDELVWILLLLTGLAGLGWLGLIWRFVTKKSWSAEDRPIWHAFWMFVLMVIMLGVFAALKGVTQKEDLFIGRYFLITMIPIAGLLVIGWRELLPPAWRQEGLAFFVSFLLLFDTVTLLGYVIPFFYPLWR